MLSSEQQAELATALCATAETLGQTLSASAAELMAEDLAEYEEADVGNALRACRRELSGKLTLAEVLRRIGAADGRPEANEAWALALEANDETRTVVLSAEIFAALTVCRPVLSGGDKIGARMAFISAYQREVDMARRERKPVAWQVSLGSDPQHRALAIAQSVKAGRLPAPKAQALLSRLSAEPISQDGAAVAGLLTGRAAMPSEGVRQKLSELKNVIGIESARRRDEKRKTREAERLAFEEKKARQVQAVESMLEGSDRA